MSSSRTNSKGPLSLLHLLIQLIIIRKPPRILQERSSLQSQKSATKASSPRTIAQSSSKSPLTLAPIISLRASIFSQVALKMWGNSQQTTALKPYPTSMRATSDPSSRVSSRRESIDSPICLTSRRASSSSSQTSMKALRESLRLTLWDLEWQLRGSQARHLQAQEHPNR